MDEVEREAERRREHEDREDRIAAALERIADALEEWLKRVPGAEQE